MFSEAIENDDVFKLKELLNCGSLVAVKCKSHADQVNDPLICISKIRKPRPISPLFSLVLTLMDCGNFIDTLCSFGIGNTKRIHPLS